MIWRGPFLFQTCACFMLSFVGAVKKLRKMSFKNTSNKHIHNSWGRLVPQLSQHGKHLTKDSWPPPSAMSKGAASSKESGKMLQTEWLCPGITAAAAGHYMWPSHCQACHFEPMTLQFLKSCNRILGGKSFFCLMLSRKNPIQYHLGFIGNNNTVNQVV